MDKIKSDFGNSGSSQFRYMSQILVDQLKLLIRLRWLAAIGIVCAGIVSTKVYPVLETAVPIYICAGFLLVLNLIYSLLIYKQRSDTNASYVVLGMVQVELDMVILTLLLHFSGGVINPFVLFYTFHVIIATIILPRTLSYFVGLSAIIMFGIMAVGEMEGWYWLGHRQLLLSSPGSLWENPVYVLGEFVALVTTVVFAQYLTRTVLARMRAKEIEAARNHDLLKAIIQAMSEGLIFIANNGKLVICNPQAHRWCHGDCR